MRMLRRTATAAALLALAAAPLRAQTSGAAVLNIDPSARSYALGSADAIAASGAQAVGRNPANMGLMEKSAEVFAAYLTLPGDAHFEHTAAAFRPGFMPEAVDTLGISVSRLDVGGIPGADSNANFTGASYTAADTAVTVGVSGRLSRFLRYGIDVKNVQSRIASYSAEWNAVDLGLTATFTPGDRPFSLALAAANVGPGAKYASQTDPLPTVVKIAAAVPLSSHAMALLQMQNFVYDHVTGADAGVECALGPFSLRAGYAYAFNTQSNRALADESLPLKLLGGLTGGIGMLVGPVRIDYAISQQAVDYGPTQRLALTVAWGAKAKAKAGKSKASATDEARGFKDDRADWVLESVGNY
ncbi:MAG: hypothetical protein ACHQ2Z_00055 [Elusimicrobiota bacterium]